MDETEIADNLLPPPPERIGPYRIESRLGVGGMGAVYLAYDERLERPVAIKRILPEMAGDTKAMKRLRREAQTVARLNHPAIVQIFDIVEKKTGDWIVMELVEGESLYSMIKDGPLELDRALDLIRQVTEGLAAAHAKGIVHRDLKAENVMVGADGRAKILDFGLAKRLWHQGEKSLSIEGSILGTGRSMSPEQALGDTVDDRSDLFSLGTLIYEVVTGQAPFAGASIFKVLAQVCSDPHVPIRERNHAVPQELSDLVDRLLEKDPERRPADAAEVLEALDAIAALPPPEPSPSPGGRETPAPARAGDGDTGERTPTLWMKPAPGAGRPGESTSGLYIRTLLQISAQDPTLEASGSEAVRAQALAARHDRMVRDLLAHSGGLEIERLDDGFLLLFELPAEAVAYALAYRRELAAAREREGLEIEAGVGIHLGEMFMSENRPADVSRGAQLLEVQGPAKLIARRTAALARGGRILMTQMAFELARRALTGKQGEDEELDWLSRGRYQLEGVEETQPIFEVGVRETLDPTPPNDTSTARRLPGRRDDETPAIGRPRKRGRWLVAAAAAATGLALALLWLARSDTPTDGERRRSMAVLGFKNLSGNPETNWLSTALAELLAAELATGGDLRLVSGESVARMKRELSLPAVDSLAADTLRAVRRNLDADHVLLGSYLAIDRQQDPLRLNLRLQPAIGGDAAVVSATGSESELFELVSRAASGVREELRLGRISARDAAAVRATLGANPEATRLYSEGLARLRGYDALGARDLLTAAVAADPDYALAYAALARTWSELGYDKRAQESARRAFELAKNLPGASYLAIEGRFHEVSGQWTEAEETYRVLRDWYPDDVDVALALAEAQTRAGHGREALATVESLRRLPPVRDDPRIDLAEATAREALSDYEGAVAAAERAVAKGRENGARILVAEALKRQWRPLRDLGRTEEAEAALEEARRLFAQSGDRGSVAEVLSGVALLLEDRGRLARAESLYRQALEIHREIGDRKGVAEGLNNLADLILDRGELEAAREMVGQAVANAREIGDRELEAKYLDTQAWVLLRMAELAEASARAREAIAIYQAIGKREGLGWGRYYLGRVAFARGELQAAQAEYQAALEIGREIGSNHLPSFALHSLAEVSLARGDLETAASHEAGSRAVASELTPAEIALLRCRLLLASGQLEEAESATRKLVRELRAEERRDDELAASALLAETLRLRGDLDAARDAIERALDLARESQNPLRRIEAELAAASVQAAGGDLRAARRRAEAAVEAANRRGLGGLVLEARLTLGEIEVAAGEAAGRERLEALAAEAAERGYARVAQRASAS